MQNQKVRAYLHVTFHRKTCDQTFEKNRMIQLIAGNTGSGKTTYPNELESKTNGIIFSIDKWDITLFLSNIKPTDGLEWFPERIKSTEKMITNLVDQLENSKTDSTLYPGLSKFDRREKFRKFADLNGYKFKADFLDI